LGDLGEMTKTTYDNYIIIQQVTSGDNIRCAAAVVKYLNDPTYDDDIWILVREQAASMLTSSLFQLASLLLVVR
jgi:hypothetical protein